MRGCTCATCEGARAYNQQPQRKIAQARRQRERRAAWTLEQHADHAARQRALHRAQADARDAARLADIVERNSQS